MLYISYFDSPLGKIFISADDNGLKGLTYEQEAGNIFNVDLKDVEYSDDYPVVLDAKLWLSIYFSGAEPDFMPALSLEGSEFRRQVWEILLTIPYGHSMTYGEIAQLIARKRGTGASAQAVGGAVANNPIAVIVPCHRVLGAQGALGGYSGGTERKKFLLNLEKIEYVE